MCLVHLPHVKAPVVVASHIDVWERDGRYVECRTVTVYVADRIELEDLDENDRDCVTTPYRLTRTVVDGKTMWRQEGQEMIERLTVQSLMLPPDTASIELDSTYFLAVLAYHLYTDDAVRDLMLKGALEEVQFDIKIPGAMETALTRPDRSRNDLMDRALDPQKMSYAAATRQS